MSDLDKRIKDMERRHRERMESGRRREADQREENAKRERERDIEAKKKYGIWPYTRVAQFRNWVRGTDEYP